jgi:magnesium transporter
MRVISELARKYSLHPLAIEDLLHTGQRPKADPYPAQGEFQARLFILMKMISLEEGGVVRSEQISIFAGHNTVLTFQESPGDVWDCIRERIRKPGSRLRNNDASFLVYSLVDANVDSIFPILETIGERLEALEDSVMDQPAPGQIREIHSVKRQLQVLKRAVWPMRELIHSLQMESHECFSETSRLYLRDVYDHVIQIIDVIESHREMSISLAETYMNMVGQRMNEIMKVLTIIGTIFIPLTFLAGVYGMNFEWMPELKTRWAYPLFWVVCTVMALLMFLFFRRRRWL